MRPNVVTFRMRGNLKLKVGKTNEKITHLLSLTDISCTCIIYQRFSDFFLLDAETRTKGDGAKYFTPFQMVDPLTFL